MNFEFKEESGLEFTGNWFIDSGVLGFVRLLEDIYGIELQEIREIARRKEILYFGLFPFAYICSEINRKATAHSRVPKDLINEFRFELLNSDWESGEEIFEFTWNNYVTRAAMKVWVERKLESVLFKKNGVDELPSDLKDSVTSIKKDADELEKKLVEKHADDLNKILGHRSKRFKSDDIAKILSVTDDDLREFPEDLSYSFKEYRDCLLNLMGLFEEKWKRDVVGKERVPEALDLFYRLPIDNKFYKNFLFFQYSAAHQKQKESLLDIISFRVEDLEVLKKVDKTINKFLTSYKKAENTYYAPLTSRHLKSFSEYLFVYLISFDRAFEFFNRMGYVLFYSNDLDITYRVNRKLRIRKSKIEDQSVLLRVTWQEIIDSLIELKSEWALENMYIIKYRDVNSQTQRFVDVEYIGISKMHAAILLDDVIRENINHTLQVGKSEYVWLLEHLIQNKPLKPVVMRHLVMRASGRTGQMSIKPLIYALAIDSEVFSGLKACVFEDPLEISPRMEEVVFRIKEAYGEMNTARRNVTELIPRGTRENTLNHLMSILRRNNRYLFVNTLLKILMQENEAFHRLKNYLFNRILQNDETWDIYAAALLTGFLGGR